MTTIYKTFGLDVGTLAEKRQFRFVASSERPGADRTDDIVVQSGINYSDFMKLGGTMLWQHMPEFPVCRCVELGLRSALLSGTAQFPPQGTSQKADEIYGLMKEHIVNAVSIGFAAQRSEPIDPKNKHGAQRWLATSLIEISLVSCPANVDAVITQRALKYGRVLNADNHGRLKQAHGLIGDVLATAGDCDDQKADHAQRLRQVEALSLAQPPLSDDHARRLRDLDVLRLGAVS